MKERVNRFLLFTFTVKVEDVIIKLTGGIYEL